LHLAVILIFGLGKCGHEVHLFGQGQAFGPAIIVCH
jgi:hypothetical protein